MLRIPRFIALPWRRAERIARDVDDEIAFHLHMRARELATSGLADDEARARAAREFGDVDIARRRLVAIDRGHDRVARRERWLAEVGQDARYALRQLVTHRAFALVAILTLALGIGANTAIFSVVHRVLIAPLAMPHADRVAFVWRADSARHVMIGVGEDELALWRRSSRTLEQIEPHDGSSVTLTGLGAPEVLFASYVTGSYLRFVGGSPARGRTFTADEQRPGGPDVAMLGYGFWQSRFGGRDDAIGRAITLDGRPYTIIGVMPASTYDSGAPQGGTSVWLPLVLGAKPNTPGSSSLHAVLARLRENVTAADAERELRALSRHVDVKERGFAGMEPTVMRATDMVSPGTKTALVVLLGAVGVVLLIACVNVANLLLARGAARERELAVRAALGAGRWRLVRQLMAESLLLSALGGALGVALAWRGLDAIVALRPEGLDAIAGTRIDPSALAFALALALVTGLLFGLIPALHASAPATGELLKRGGAHHGSTRVGRRSRATLVTIEIALSILLLVGAGLLARSVVRLQHTELGFRPEGVWAMHPVLPPSRYANDTTRREFAEQVVARVRGIPGVGSATIADGVPPRAGVTFGRLEIEGRSEPTVAGKSAYPVTFVSAGYFRTLGIRLLEGRPFASDTSDGERSVIINATMARQMWRGRSAIGQHIRLGEGKWETVIGVVDDVRGFGATAVAEPVQLYYPFYGSPQPQIVVRVRAGATPPIAAMKRQLWAIDPTVPIREVVDVSAEMQRALAGPRFNLMLLGIFAGLALVLAAVGLYGVISYSVAQRTREIGIRMALGARAGDVVRHVVSDGMRPALAGLALGLAGALALARVLDAILYGLSPYDAATYAAVALALTLVALLACWLPARRAARVDPLEAMRAE